LSPLRSVARTPRFWTLPGLSAHLAAFEARHVQLSDLPELTEDDLRLEFGLVSFMDRKRFRAMVADLTESADRSPDAFLSGATVLSTDATPSLSGATVSGDVPPPSLSGATVLATDATPSLAGATRGLTMMGKAVSASTLDLAALPTGTMFDGRYTIVDLLGRGGMGAVYQALDTRVKQTVALKTLPTQAPALLDALSREASLAQQLNHPNLLRIRHPETRGDAPYVVMEPWTGETSRRRSPPKGGFPRTRRVVS
jgi:hypothetical protein